MGDDRGSIAFFSTYRPPVPLDIYSSPIRPNSKKDEFLMTDGRCYNYNGHEIPSEPLKTMIRHTRLGLIASPEDVDNGDVSGIMFVSERIDNLETLHVALCFDNEPTTPRSILNQLPCSDGMPLQEIQSTNLCPPLPKQKVMIFPLADLYRRAYKGVRMEDNACFSGGRYLIFNSTMQSPPKGGRTRQPWNAVYKMDLVDGETTRLTPPGVADFSPSVSPCGGKIAVATLEYKKGGWAGEVEDILTDIVVMNLNHPHNRRLVIKDGGWPSWGSDNIIYFHRVPKQIGPRGNNPNNKNWGVFRADLNQLCTRNYCPVLMTPDNVNAMTPAAIDEYRVAVAIIRERLPLNEVRKSPNNFRHIEVFDSRSPQSSLSITKKIDPYADHYNPFVIWDGCEDDDDDEDEGDDEDVLIGYSRCKDVGGVTNHYDKIKLSDPPRVGLYRVPGVFPTFTKDGKKLAFVDNGFQRVYLADSEGGLRVIFNVSSLKLPEDESSVFSPVWNQNQQKDTLYICVGPAFSATKPLHIYAICNASSTNRQCYKITDVDASNNAFPSTNPEGTRMIFRSTRDWLSTTGPAPLRPKNLYTLDVGGQCGRKTTSTIKRVTNGNWIDTHCDWSPNGQWITFSSTRDKPKDAPPLDTESNDAGYYAVYLMKANDTNVMVRVVTSGSIGAGHVNHPIFSPDGYSLCFSADLAAVSVEPISLPLFIHSVRPYGDIFSVDINKHDIYANKDLTNFKRVTHSRYENSTPNWSMFTACRLSNEWIALFKECYRVANFGCPFATGGVQNNRPQLTLANLGAPRRCC